MKTLLALIILSIAISVQAAQLPKERLFESFDLTDYVLKLEISRVVPFSKKYRTTLTGGPLPVTRVFKDILQKQNEPRLAESKPAFFYPTATNKITHKEHLPITRVMATMLDGLGYKTKINRRSSSLTCR